VLTDAEDLLNNCKDKECNKIIRNIYNTVPASLYKVYSENLEIAGFIRSRPSLQSLLSHSPAYQLVAYPNKEFYKDEPLVLERTSNNYDRRNGPLISFTPPFLNFGFRYFTPVNHSPIGIQIEDIITIRVSSKSEDITISVVLADNPLLDATTISGGLKFIKRGGSLQFKVVFTCLVYGNNPGYLLFKLSNGKSFLYKVMAHGIDNKFNLKPLFLNTNRLNYTETIPVNIKNPFNNRTLNLHCVSTSEMNVRSLYEGKEILCNNDVAYITIPPLMEINAFNVSVDTLAAGNVLTLLTIKEIDGSYIKIPLLTKVNTEANIYPHIIDFGTANPSDIPHRIMIHIDTSSESVRITKITYRKAPEFFLYFPIMSEYYSIIPKSSKPTLLGYITFHSPFPGNYKGSVFIYTNCTKVTRLDLKAKVVVDSFYYEANKVYIDVLGKSSEKYYYKEISLKNGMNSTLVFHGVELGLRNVSAYLGESISDRTDSQVLQYKEKKNLLSLKYSPDKTWTYPLNHFISLFSTNTIFYIPITFYESNIICQYVSCTNGNEVTERCVLINEINLGVFSETTKTLNMRIINNDPIPINIKNLQIDSDFCCLEVLDENNKALTSLDKVNSTTKDLLIQPGFSMVLRLQLSLTKCRKHTSRPIEAEPFIGRLTFDINDSSLMIKLIYSYRSGEFSFSPAPITFDSGFPGIVQSKTLRVISTFKVPLRILNTKTADPSISYKWTITQINSNSKIEIGEVIFTSSDLPEEKRLSELQASILSWNKNAIALAEYKFWRERKLNWDNFNNLVVNTQILVNTDIVQDVKLPIIAEFVQPALMQDSTLNFRAILNNSRKELSITLYNPSVEPLLIQLFPLDPIFNNYKQNATLVFADKKNPCEESYEQWMEKYNTIMQQLKNKEEITYYTTFEDFAEDYCCYTGKYNASLLYSSTDNILQKYCDSKSISIISSKKDNTLFDLVTRTLKKPQESEMIPIGDFKYPKRFAEKPLLIKPMSYYTIGPICYTPSSVGNHTAMIFIKNNLTVFYPVELKGEAGTAILNFVKETYLGQNKLLDILPEENLDLIKEDVGVELEYKITQEDFLVSGTRMQKNTRSFTLRNIGNMPLTVTDISIDDRECGAHGIQVMNCKSFTLEPRHEHVINITYTINPVFTYARHKLIFNTLAGTQTFWIAIKVQQELIEAVQSTSLMKRYVVNNCSMGVKMVLALFMILIGGFVVLATVCEVIHAAPKKVSSQSLVNKVDEECNAGVLSKTLNDVVKNKEKFFNHIKDSPIILKEVDKKIKENEESHKHENAKVQANTVSELKEIDSEKIHKNITPEKSKEVETSPNESEVISQVNQIETITPESKVVDKQEDLTKVEEVITEQSETIKKSTPIGDHDLIVANNVTDIKEFTSNYKDPIKEQSETVTNEEERENMEGYNDKPISKDVIDSKKSIELDKINEDLSKVFTNNVEEAKDDKLEQEDVQQTEQSLDLQSTEKQTDSNDTPTRNNEECASNEVTEQKEDFSNAQEENLGEDSTSKEQYNSRLMSESYSRRNKQQFEPTQEGSGTHYRQRKFEYRRYQNYNYGRYYKKSTVRYAHKQPHVIYKRKVKPSIVDDNEAGSFAYMEKNETEVKNKREKVSEEEDTVTVEETIREKTDSNVEKKIMEESKVKDEKKTSSNQGKRTSAKSKGLGGILLEPNEEYSEEDDLMMSVESQFRTLNDNSKEETRGLSEITLLEAFNFANSLLGYKTFSIEQKKATVFSPLSELRGDSIEYNPSEY